MIDREATVLSLFSGMEYKKQYIKSGAAFPPQKAAPPVTNNKPYIIRWYPHTNLKKIKDVEKSTFAFISYMV